MTVTHRQSSGQFREITISVVVRLKTAQFDRSSAGVVTGSDGGMVVIAIRHAYVIDINTWQLARLVLLLTAN